MLEQLHVSFVGKWNQSCDDQGIEAASQIQAGFFLLDSFDDDDFVT